MLGNFSSQRTELEDHIPGGHPLRAIDRIVSKIPIREIVRDKYAPGKGRPSFSPEVYVRIVLIGYLFNIGSDRKLCAEIRFNIAYRWFCHLSLSCLIPHYSTLSRTKTRLGLAIAESIFYHLIQLWQRIGLIAVQTIIIDATLVAEKWLDTVQPSLWRTTTPCVSGPVCAEGCQSLMSPLPHLEEKERRETCPGEVVFKHLFYHLET